MKSKFLILFLICCSNAFASVDTILVKLNYPIPDKATAKWSLLPSVSASFTTYTNWLSNNYNTLLLLSNIDFRHRKQYDSGWSYNHLLKVEAGYLNYIDSLWIKNADSFKLTLQWNEKPGKYFAHSYGLYLKTQLLKSYRYKARNDSIIKEIRGWFMAPALLELSYGFNRTFWDESTLNIAFATCRVEAEPESESTVKTDEQLFKWGNRIVSSEYGFSAQLYIKRDFFGKVIQWDHQGRYFYKALSKKGVHADISNRFVIRFLKYLQLRLDSQFIYDPDISMKGSYKNEFLLGIFYEVKK